MITIKELKTKLTTRSRLIGLDLGSKRIGIGICDENQIVATPFKTINKTNLKDIIKQLKEIIEENNVKGIIVGNPINMDGSFGKSSQSVKDTVISLEKSSNLNDFFKNDLDPDFHEIPIYFFLLYFNKIS